MNILMNNDYILIHILKYLDVKDLMRTSYTNKTIYNIIYNSDNCLFDNFEMVYNKEELPINYKFLLKKIELNPINSLNLILCENLLLAKLILKKVNVKNLKKLIIPLAIFRGKTDLQKFKEIIELSIKNMYFNEVGMEYNLFLIPNIFLLSNLKKLKLNNIKYINAEFLNFLQCKLEHLDLRECMDFKIEDFSNYLLKVKDTLKVLKLDGENSNLNHLINIIPNMDSLNELTISYCENLNDNFLEMIMIISQKFKKLTLRKLRNISSKCFENFFQNSLLYNLEKIDFYDAPKLNDKSVSYLSKFCNIKYIDISWSDNVKNESIIKIFLNCKKLEKIYLQGCKSIDDEVFEKCFIGKKNINKFDNLKLIDLTKCDLVSDNIILDVYNEFPWISIINYYGRDLRDDDYNFLI